MMQDRGLSVVDTCKSERQLMSRIDDCKPIIRASASADAAAPMTTLVFIDADERTGVKLVRALREKYVDDSLCIISAEGTTPFTKKEVAGCDNLEFWHVHEMLTNPTRHQLVPRHVALTEAEATHMQTQKCIKSHQWPLIPSSDIIVRWYRFRRGTVVRIERKGIGYERGDYFRKVQ